jgi:hypothetical protein
MGAQVPDANNSSGCASVVVDVVSGNAVNSEVPGAVNLTNLVVFCTGNSNNSVVPGAADVNNSIISADVNSSAVSNAVDVINSLMSDTVEVDSVVSCVSNNSDVFIDLNNSVAVDVINSLLSDAVDSNNFTPVVLYTTPLVDPTSSVPTVSPGINAPVSKSPQTNTVSINTNTSRRITLSHKTH